MIQGNSTDSLHGKNDQAMHAEPNSHYQHLILGKSCQRVVYCGVNISRRIAHF
ncbi:hypothetical protein VCSRO69_2501 [Vibrio cholerae]|nr:hypothetical protein VCSRO69_2501 [Vibrio cholerae]